jgi:hypothetical protein
LSLAVVQDLREARTPAGPQELAALETDVMAGLILGSGGGGAGRCHDHLRCGER